MGILSPSNGEATGKNVEHDMETGSQNGCIGIVIKHISYKEGCRGCRGSGF